MFIRQTVEGPLAWLAAETTCFPGPSPRTVEQGVSSPTNFSRHSLKGAAHLIVFQWLADLCRYYLDRITSS